MLGLRRQLKNIWNLIQENSENNYEFSSAEKGSDTDIMFQQYAKASNSSQSRDYLSTIDKSHQGPRRGWEAPSPNFFRCLDHYFFFTLVNQVCLLQKKYITLFYVKYVDLLGNAALF